MGDNNGTWGTAILIQLGIVVFWVVAAMTPIGQALWNFLVGVNGVGS